ncbi:recombinase [Yersinia similis]|uniref:Recombinase n=1 Tax=Yersinia similis TaxID=367190 RepID=A0ABM5Q2E9_9GAMM|nr:ERF family protein [Yersinia similis]AHK20717.1 recombinase [Yersinia similis]CFQ60383.1 ERF superfamily [Yersinia similis]
MSKEFYAKLAGIQQVLNAPKNQYNSFGKYNYRSCEDILEGVKPLLKGLFLSISDEVVMIGARHYVRATARITDGESMHEATALAREEESKKGMDAAQVTGSTSSYARKYCLNGLLAIDDAKDADTNEHKQQSEQEPTPPQKTKNTPHLRTADQILADFTSQASNCQYLDELMGIYKPAWNALANSADHQSKCVEVFRHRSTELKPQKAA